MQNSIQQADSNYLYSISIDGETVFEVVNTQAEVFDDVTVYTGNTWFSPACVFIRSLEISTEEGEWTTNRS